MVNLKDNKKLKNHVTATQSGQTKNDAQTIIANPENEEKVQSFLEIGPAAFRTSSLQMSMLTKGMLENYQKSKEEEDDSE